MTNRFSNLIGSAKYKLAQNSNTNTLHVTLAMETDSYTKILNVSFTNEISDINSELSKFIDNKSLDKVDKGEYNSSIFTFY